MNKDKISAFTLRIASSNGTGIINVLYDIYREYENEAIVSFHAGLVDEAVEALKKCSEVVSHLQKDLNFSYNVSRDLYALYDYVQRCISRSMYKANDEGLNEAKVVMDSLGEAFAAIAAEDKTEPIMKNTQSVMAGYTYGRHALNEDLMNNQVSRGFWA